MKFVCRAVLVLSLCGTGCGSPGPGAPNIILVSIDSLRHDHLGCYGYPAPTTPFIDSLAAAGVRFETAVSTTSWTLPAHAALFTGLYDSTHGLVDNGLRLGDGQRTLAEVLREAGYRTAGFYGGPYLHPTFGLGQGFDEYRSCMTTTPEGAAEDEVRSGARAVRAASHEDVTGPRTRDAVAAWAARGGVEPYFLFLHLWDVHYDYIAPDDYVALFDPDYAGDLDGRAFTANPRLRYGMDPRDLQHLIALYDAEVRFTDDVLRQILDDLKSRGMLDNTLVVITADHGEEFFEHGGKGHQRTLYDEVIRVPLIFYWPRSIPAGQVVGRQVRTIDVLPTLAAIAGVNDVLPVQGRDLGPLLRQGDLPAMPALSELLVDGRTARSLRTEQRKIVRPREGGPSVLLDVAADPAEMRPILADSPRRDELADGVRQLDAALSRALAARELLLGAEPESLELQRELLEQLRGLGYVDQ